MKWLRVFMQRNVQIVAYSCHSRHHNSLIVATVLPTLAADVVTVLLTLVTHTRYSLHTISKQLWYEKRK